MPQSNYEQISPRLLVVPNIAPTYTVQPQKPQNGACIQKLDLQWGHGRGRKVFISGRLIEGWNFENQTYLNCRLVGVYCDCGEVVKGSAAVENLIVGGILYTKAWQCRPWRLCVSG